MVNNRLTSDGRIIIRINEIKIINFCDSFFVLYVFDLLKITGA